MKPRLPAPDIRRMLGRMSDSYQVHYHNGRGEVELRAVRLDDGFADTADGDSGSDAERTEGGEEDSRSLIATTTAEEVEEEEVDEDGVARDYEVALKHVGFGLFHALLMAINGVSLLADAMEV